LSLLYRSSSATQRSSATYCVYCVVLHVPVLVLACPSSFPVGCVLCCSHTMQLNEYRYTQLVAARWPGAL
jgi:hypothetical protein